MNKIGRPTKMTQVRLGKLREAFMMGSTDEEACIYAQIHPSTLYEYQQKNPDFSEEKEAWKLNPVLKARKTIYDNLDSIATARWFLERKQKDEFGVQPHSPQDTGKQSLTDLMRELEDEEELEEKPVRSRIVHLPKKQHSQTAH